MDTLRKRRYSSIERAEPYATKKARSTPADILDINTLPYEEKCIVAQAADILHVPVSQLRWRINELEDSSLTSIGFYDCPQQPPRTKRRRSSIRMKTSPKSEPLYLTLPSEKSAIGADSGIDDSNGNQDASQQWTGLDSGNDSYFDYSSSSLQISTRERDSTFGFQKGGMFADCLASFCFNEDPSPLDNGYGSDYMAPNMPTYENKVMGNVVDHTSTSMMPYSQEAIYGQMNGMNGADPNMQTAFGCDTAPFVEQWWFPALQPTQIHNQPIVHKQEMVYAQPASAPGYSDWNQQSIVMGGSLPSYSQTTYADSAFHDSDASHSFVKVETELDSDSGPNIPCANTGSCDGPGRRGRRPFTNLADRAQTAQTRKDGSCVRCRAQRIRCVPDPADPKGICLTCKNVKSVGGKPQKPLCVRYKITEVRLYKPGQVPGLEWSSRWTSRTLKDINTWASSETKIIQVSEGYTSTPLKLVVREFKAIEGDVVHRKWVAGGVKKSVLVPSYAIADLAAAKSAYEEYINNGGAEFFAGALDPKNKFLWMTYSMAIDTSNDTSVSEADRRLLKMVLRLWVAIRLNTRATNIVGSETLGMPADILDETHPNAGSIPIPPVMGNQIELILSRWIQERLRTEILDTLQKLIYSHKTTSWLTIYLSTFILLHNCTLITRHDAAYARKHGIEARFARPAMVAEYHFGANIILAHFHYCNKNSYPFSSSGATAEILAVAGLNEKQLRFVESTRKFVNSKAEKFEDLRWQGLYENDYYFVAQLYEQNWKPRSTI